VRRARDLDRAARITGPADAAHARALLSRHLGAPARLDGLLARDLPGAAPEDLGAWHAALLDDRATLGAFYTPRALADMLAEGALGALGGDHEAVKVLDPACGGGALLVATARALRARGRALDPAAFFGVDLDPGAARAARRALALELGEREVDLGDRIVAADALTDALPWPDGGFDVVVANPPYAPVGAAHAQALRGRFNAATYKLDAYPMFIERAVELLRVGGVAALLTPNTYATSTFGEDLRRWLLERAALLSLTALEGDPFPGVRVDLAVTVLRRGAAPEGHEVAVRRRARGGDAREVGRVAQRAWSHSPGAAFRAPSGDDALCEAMDRVGVPLGQVARAYFGVQTRARAEFVREAAPDEGGWAPCVDGAHVQRYRLLPPTEFVCTRPEAIKSGGDTRVHGRDRILVRQIGRRPTAALAPGGTWALNTVYNLWLREGSGFSLLEVLGVLLSDPVGRYWERRFWDGKRTFPKVKKASLLAAPLPPRSVVNVPRYAELEALVGALVAGDEVADEADVQRSIDALVGEMYGAW
jgi:SAM-dependent methyltransferase